MKTNGLGMPLRNQRALQYKIERPRSNGLTIEKEINERFFDYVFNWDYKQYLCVGGYGSGKSYHTAFKIILKCLEEKRKVLVVRQVYDTIRESCFDLFVEILDEMGLLVETKAQQKERYNRFVAYKTSPMEFTFFNGSKIIFKGLDKPQKLKSINGVTIIWIEEASEINYAAYKELLGRLRHPSLSLHVLLTLNPVDTENWVYKRFFKHKDEETGDIIITLDDELLYSKRTIVKNNVYYHHSIPTDNQFITEEYVNTLDDLLHYDPDLYRVARWGRFGINGRRVLPNFYVNLKHSEIMKRVRNIPEQYRFIGLDFGFEESYNALIKCAVDDEKKDLYIYAEYYQNHKTDDETLQDFRELGLDKLNRPIKADAAEPKAITYYRKSGIRMVACRKFAGSRLAYLRKIKRFKHIYCSPRCENTIRELKSLTYATDKNGALVYDQFNIDSHTLSAITYALDSYDVADIKIKSRNSYKGV